MEITDDSAIVVSGLGYNVTGESILQYRQQGGYERLPDMIIINYEAQ